MNRIKTAWNWVATAIGWLIMIGLTVFLLEELVRVGLWTIPEWGFWTAITDGVILHKLGELLVLPPLVAFALFNRWESGKSKPSPLAMRQIEELLERT